MVKENYVCQLQLCVVCVWHLCYFFEVCCRAILFLNDFFVFRRLGVFAGIFCQLARQFAASESKYIYLEVSKKCTIHSLEICFSSAKVNLANKTVFAGIQWPWLEICSVGRLCLLPLSKKVCNLSDCFEKTFQKKVCDSYIGLWENMSIKDWLTRFKNVILRVQDVDCRFMTFTDKWKVMTR